jgi:uncharacterized Ntn-hydrolase superfamily protein
MQNRGENPLKENNLTIIGSCPDTGDLAAVVISSAPAVGAYTPFVKKGAGIVCMFGWFYPGLAQSGLSFLEQGMSANLALNKLLSNPNGSREFPVAILDDYGNVSAFSESHTDQYCGHLIGTRYVIQGQGLANDETLYGIKTAFDQSSGEISHRMISALRKRITPEVSKDLCIRSAVLVVARDPVIPYMNLRVDDHCDPLREMTRCHEIMSQQLKRRFLKSIGEKRMTT